MPIDALLSAAMAHAKIARFGVCAWDPSLLLPGVRSAARLPKNAKSVVVCLFPYFVGIPAPRNLSLYSMIADYHAVAGGMLSEAADMLSAQLPGHAFVPFVDASPLHEVEAGRRAGLGVRGQNSQLLTPEAGSLAFLGELVTDLALPVSAPAGECEHCGRCLAACPTGALSERGVDSARCRSAITQKKGVLCEAERREIAAGGLAWGCDLCTLACPHNQTDG
ncbi:MAG: DUF1730 domain-containing protein, partial [Oscillospiraceae bacterium]